MIKFIEYKDEYRHKVIDFWTEICIKEFGFANWENNIKNMDNDTYKKNNGNFWIALKDESIIGTISLKNIGDGTGILKGMYIHKDYRKKNIATKLMQILHDFVKEKDYKKIILDTYEKCSAAIVFYQKRGFKIVEKNEDRYILSKDLSLEEEKRKVGILTFHDAHNYGAVLQAYALKKYIQKLGYNAKIINYHHETIPDGFPKENNEIRWEKFNDFIAELMDYEEKVYTTEEELEKLDMDYWICGSDQIWNTEITRGFNRGFFLDFKTKGRKISYAVSMGIPELPKDHEEDFRKAINKLHAIGVREETLKLYTQCFTDKEVIKTLDPTLLLQASDYDKLTIDNQYGDYILIYALGPDDRLTQVAKKVANEKHVKIIELNDKKQNNYLFEQVSEAGPDEFLTLIKNAKAVITNSFHGTIFSIIFQKDFYTITRGNRNSRMENILDIIGMKDRLIENVEDIENVKKQDYVKAISKLEIEREMSQNFLNEVLS